MTAVPRRMVLERSRLRQYLENLVGQSDTSAATLFIPSRPRPDDLDKRLQQLALPGEIIEEVTRIASHSGTGSVIFRRSGEWSVIIPPFPIEDDYLSPSLDVQPIIKSLERDYLIAIVLVRLGSFAVGVCRGEEILTSKVGTGLVHGRHRQGGSSARRFERHRDKQIEYFFTRVCQHACEHIEPYVKSLDFLVYGGARTTLIDLLKQCRFLERLETATLPPLLDIPEPRQKILKDTVKKVWSGTVTEWRGSE